VEARIDTIQAVRHAYHAQDQGLGDVAARFGLSRQEASAILCLPPGTDLRYIQGRLREVTPEMSPCEAVRAVRGDTP
jgi:hypothetical protein